MLTTHLLPSRKFETPACLLPRFGLTTFLAIMDVFFGARSTSKSSDHDAGHGHENSGNLSESEHDGASELINSQNHIDV